MDLKETLANTVLKIIHNNKSLHLRSNHNLKNMKTSKKLIIFSLLLIVAITNYFRIVGADEIRGVGFISIFAIGAISGLLFREIVVAVKNK